MQDEAAQDEGAQAAGVQDEEAQNEGAQAARGQVAVEWVAGVQVSKVQAAGIVAAQLASFPPVPLLEESFVQVVEEELQVLVASCLLCYFHQVLLSPFPGSHLF